MNLAFLIPLGIVATWLGTIGATLVWLAGWSIGAWPPLTVPLYVALSLFAMHLATVGVEHRLRDHLRD